MLTTFNNPILNLELLAEECAEVIQIKSKIIRFGLTDTHPEGGPTNLDRLHQEIGDLLTIIGLLVGQGMLDENKLEEAADRKAAKLVEWEERYHQWAQTQLQLIKP